MQWYRQLDEILNVESYLLRFFHVEERLTAAAMDVAAFEEGSEYPRSFVSQKMLLDVGNSECSSGLTTCERTSEPIVFRHLQTLRKDGCCMLLMRFVVIAAATYIVCYAKIVGLLWVKWTVMKGLQRQCLLKHVQMGCGTDLILRR